MIRGTTPTFTFRIPFLCSEISLLNVVFVQQGQIVVEKNLSDCSLSENKIQVELTEEETLKFDCAKSVVEIQLRVGCGTRRLASQIIKVGVRRILKEGCL